MTVFGNGKNIPLNVATGTVPNLNSALANWFQPMTFGVVSKVINGYEVVEAMQEIRFQGVIQPMGARQLVLKPEGQRAWTWFQLHSNPSLKLQVDSVVIYLGKQTRVMARKNYEIYGYIEYDLVQDWTGAGPEIAETIIDGSQPDTVFENDVSGGAPNTDFLTVFDGGEV